MQGVVFKYPLPKVDYGSGKDIDITMPKSATFLDIQIQDSRLVMWFLVNPKNPMVSRTFCLKETGNEFETRGLMYLGTVQMSQFYVIHLFERTNKA